MRCLRSPKANGIRMSALIHGMTPKTRPLSPKRSALVAVLDVGTSKIACLIARLKPQSPQEVLRRRSHSIDVIGFGHTLARGMKSGAVVDLEAAEAAIRQAFDLAERTAKMQLESVVVSVSAGKPASERISASVDVVGAAVSEGDIARVLAAGGRHSVRPGRAVLHSLPIGYSLDSTTGIRDPRGMLGRRFGIDMHLATLDAAVARNLMLAIERCHVGVEALTAGPYAAGLSVLADDEADLGAALIDMGAGTTTIAVFTGGRFVHIDGFALGGQNVTLDLARGLNARVADAERIKTLYGSVLSGSSDERDMITIPAGDHDDREAPQFVSRASLVRIIKPRIEEILEMVRDRLANSPFAAEPRGRVVLTGGGCQLPGLAELAGQILGRPVRIGRPLGISRVPEEAKGPAFAAATGLLVYPQAVHLEHFEPRRTRHLATGTGGYLTRVGRWLRESF
jgi:cell division protein FtsA